MVAILYASGMAALANNWSPAGGDALVLRSIAHDTMVGGDLDH